jgi:SAM-dependent methyltransferase
VLGSFARQVIGIEPSAHMVALAPALANATYLRASAEHIPLARSTCGLIGAGSALHWFDQAAFLAEIDRVATNDSHLVVFDHWFNGSVDGCPEFAEWFRTYLARYPSPPRDRSWSPPSDLGGWMFAGSQSYKHPVPMTVGRLTSYLLSQSNLQVMIDRGEIVEEQLRESLADELRAVITGDVAVVEFGGLVAHLRR